MHKPKRTLTSKVLTKNPWFQVRQDEIFAHDESKKRYYTIVSDPFVVICALSADRKGVTMVKNWRYPVQRYLWEFPMGWREPNETPLMAAKRELAEETGLQAKAWKSLGWFYLAPGISTQRGYVYVAERLTKQGASKANTEVVLSKEIAVAKLQQLMKKKSILDAPTHLAASYLLAYLDR